MGPRYSCNDYGQKEDIETSATVNKRKEEERKARNRYKKQKTP